MGAVTSYAQKDYKSLFKNVSGLAQLASGKQSKAEEFAYVSPRTLTSRGKSNAEIRIDRRRTKSSPADVISWSGCKDSQTSADTEVAGQGTGAMSWAFMESLSE